MDLKKRTLKNSIYSLVAFAWPILLSFVATPYIVHKLGLDKYGVLALVTSFVGFFAVLDFGVSPSLVKYVSEHHAKKDFNKVNQFFSSALIFYLSIGFIGAALIALAAIFFTPQFLKNSPGLIDLARTVFLISAAGFVINMLLSALTAIPGALQRFDLTSKLNLVVASISTLGTVLILYRGFGLLAVVTYTVTLSALAVLAYVVMDRRLIPGLRLQPRVDRPTLRQMFGFSGYAFLASISGVVIAELDRLILGFILGPSAVTYYVIPGNIAMKILGAVVAATTVIFPLTSELLAKNEKEKLQNLYLRSTRVIITVLVLGIVPLLVFAHRFLLYWLGKDFASTSDLTLQILLVTYVISALHVIPFLVAYGSGKPKYSAFYAVAVAILNVILMFALIPHFKIIGAAFAYLAAVVGPTLFFIGFVEKKLLSLKTPGFYLSLSFRMLLLAGMTFVASIFAVRFITSLKTFLLAYVVVIALSGIIFVVSPLMDKRDIELIKLLRGGNSA